MTRLTKETLKTVKPGDKIKCLAWDGGFFLAGSIYEVESVLDDQKYLRVKENPSGELSLCVYGRDNADFEILPSKPQHKHADLLRAYADDPTLQFEGSQGGTCWWDASADSDVVLFDERYHWRIKQKPKPKKIIKEEIKRYRWLLLKEGFEAKYEGEYFTTSNFFSVTSKFSTKEEAEKIYAGVWKVLQPVEGTEKIEVIEKEVDA